MNKKIQVIKNYPFVIVGAVFGRKDKIVLVQEAKTDAGMWNIPSGWLEKAENPILGAQREVEEETGIQVKITGLLGVYNSIFDKHAKDINMIFKNHHALRIIFKAEIIEEKKLKNNNEISKIGWFSEDDILKMSNNLRDPNIKNEVKDYFSGKKYPLSVIKYTKVKL